jgi:Fe(3+) dicitrate transport protein
MNELFSVVFPFPSQVCRRFSCCWFFALFTLPLSVLAQQATLQGTVFSRVDSLPLPSVTIAVSGQHASTTTDEQGRYLLKLPAGNYHLKLSSVGYQPFSQSLVLESGRMHSLSIYLEAAVHHLETVTVRDQKADGQTLDRLREVEGTAIYAGKKNEVIRLENLNANLATNNSRQIYAKVPGLNIIENDAAGIQISIATRGLNPNRTTEFNSRQNGYDISADPIGYPESYYSPPTEALDRIEVVRGAASLQYGTQFGGLLNFVFRKGAADKAIEVVSRQTGGSYGLFNSFNSIGGTKGKVNYYTFFHHKQGDGWRQNTGFHINTGYVSVTYQVNPKLSLGAEVTLMKYEMQQPGGLSDDLFAIDPRASYRNRNWFTATWLIPSLTVNYQISDHTKLNIRSYGLIAERGSVGNLSLVTEAKAERDSSRLLTMDQYRNGGTEARLLHRYSLGKQIGSLLVGGRYYQGNTLRKQGEGSTGSNADFGFVHPENLGDFNLRFPSHNLAFFAENIFRLTSRLSITPGFRFEWIETNSKNLNNPAKNQTSHRQFALLGLGVGYQVSENSDFYVNFSQNYSPINYSDILVTGTTLRVDPNLKDVTGYNADLGYRGHFRDWLTFDASVYFLAYNNRIDVLNMSNITRDSTYQYRTNVADSRNYGVETFAEISLLPLLKKKTTQASLSIYGSMAYLNATFVNTPQKSILNKKVTYAPDWIIRGGLSGKWKNISGTVQYSSVSQQFTDAENRDASNSVQQANGTFGIIPAYVVWDISLKYLYKSFQVGAGVNNLADSRYFTRRTAGFPGPGIIPAEARSWYISLGIKL